jgi:hypothetical protein
MRDLSNVNRKKPIISDGRHHQPFCRWGATKPEKQERTYLGTPESKLTDYFASVPTSGSFVYYAGDAISRKLVSAATRRRFVTLQ